MHQIHDCHMTDSTLDTLIKGFVPEKDAYFFADDEIVNACLQQGITVYTRAEFASSFPLFALHFGSVYHIWTLNRPEDSYVIFVHISELNALQGTIRNRLFQTQIEYGRGHIYDVNWLQRMNVSNSITYSFGGKAYYFLTWDDWWAFTPEIRRRWLLEWLKTWRKDEASASRLNEPSPTNVRVPYALIHEYAGTFADTSRANCFAAAIAMVVGSGIHGNSAQSRRLMTEWLHQGPFFRLLHGQGYVREAAYHTLNDFVFQPSDVLVWYTKEGGAVHAAYAITNDLVFQKQAQGWDNPWQVLKILDVSYNDYFREGGYIEVYRGK